MSIGKLIYREIGHRAPEKCIKNCKYRTEDIVDLVGDTLQNLPTCTYPFGSTDICPLNKINKKNKK